MLHAARPSSRAPTGRGGAPARSGSSVRQRAAPARAPTGVLGLQRAAGNAAVAAAVAQVQRKGSGKKAATGVARYGSTRLTDRLQDMMARGVLGVAGAPERLDRDQLFLLQGVANVETGGKDNAVYTRDNMYVSLGFKQVTLGWGSLYEIIAAAPAAFAKHGIVLGGGTYKLKAGTKPAVEGAPDPVALKTPPWTDRFFDAGQEDEVVSAMVAYTLKELGRMERRFAKDSPGRSSPWMKDPTARAWLLETMNNRPAYAYAAAKGTLARTSGQQLGREQFLEILEAEIIKAYAAHDEAVKGSHIISKIPRSGSGGSGGASGAAPRQTTVPAAGAGVDLVAKAGAVLPPGGAAGAGGAVLAAIAAAGLTGPALRLLAAAGHSDVNALTNLAFWSAHPDLFGQKLHPSQAGFRALSAEWVRLRSSVVAGALSGAGGPGGAAGGATPAQQTGPAQQPVQQPVQQPAQQPPQQGPGTGAPAGTPSPADAAFVADGLRSTIDLLPDDKQRERFRQVPWGWADYPGTQFPVAAMSSVEVARFQTDRSLELDAKKNAFVGKHQEDARALFTALARNRPGGGERRVNTGGSAVITEQEFKASADKAGTDAYITAQVDPAALPGGGKLNKHAAAAFRTMREAALAEGVELKVLSGFRSRSSEEATAKKNTNRVAFGGFSPHSLGLAADIALKVGTSSKAGFTEISTRMDKLVGMLASPAYKWVYLHGAEHGFFQYKAEPWHWEYNPPGFKETFWAER